MAIRAPDGANKNTNKTMELIRHHLDLACGFDDNSILFLHDKDTFCSKLIQLQIQTNKKIITKAERPPAVCVVLHIQVQLLDKCYDQQTSRQVFALRQFSILSRAIFRFWPGNILLNSKDDCFLYLQNNLLI